ncbi:AAA family ATPase [Acidihalobacter prosperus]|uniref:AAA family ATPase n=1 Tax=Acidihalobacter prosperus TaxID=160660 RepID=UPI001F2DA5F0|nr:ATP-binding protein [Acidihalobacter prosperus]
MPAADPTRVAPRLDMDAIGSMNLRAHTGTLIFFCGKMGAGKSTLAKTIADEIHAVLLVEDEWLAALYPNQIATLGDYAQYAGRLKPLIGPLVQSILTAGTDVVMDFPANTVAQRAWFRTLFTAAKAPHSLVFVDMSDETCLKRIEARRTRQPERASTDTAEMFERVTQYFVEPAPAEGFDVTRIDERP